MPEEYKLEIETTGDYKTKKEFNLTLKLTARQYLKLVEVILDYEDKVSKEEWDEEFKNEK